MTQNTTQPALIDTEYNSGLIDISKYNFPISGGKSKQFNTLYLENTCQYMDSNYSEIHLCIIVYFQCLSIKQLGIQ